MKQRLICKGLAVAVIILFIGVGVQPAIAKPDIVDFRLDNLDKEELTAKINEKFTTDNNWTFPFLKIFFYILFIITRNIIWLIFKIFIVAFLIIIRILFGNLWEMP